MMMGFVFILQCCQHLNGNSLCGLFHTHRLKTTLKSCILFDMLAIFFQSSRTDQLDLAPCHGRLQDIGCINGTFRRPGTDDRMDLIHEKNDIPIGTDFFQCFFHTFLKFTAVFGTGNHGRQIQTEDFLVSQGIRDIPFCDFLCQTFHNSGFADTGITSQAGIIFRSSAQYLHDTIDFCISADDGIKLSLFRHQSQISAEFFQSFCFRFFFFFRIMIHTHSSCGLGFALSQHQHDIFI